MSLSARIVFQSTPPDIFTEGVTGEDAAGSFSGRPAKIVSEPVASHAFDRWVAI